MRKVLLLYFCFYFLKFVADLVIKINYFFVSQVKLFLKVIIFGLEFRNFFNQKRKHSFVRFYVKLLRLNNSFLIFFHCSFALLFVFYRLISLQFFSKFIYFVNSYLLHLLISLQLLSLLISDSWLKLINIFSHLTKTCLLLANVQTLWSIHLDRKRSTFRLRSASIYPTLWVKEAKPSLTWFSERSLVFLSEGTELLSNIIFIFKLYIIKRKLNHCSSFLNSVTRKAISSSNFFSFGSTSGFGSLLFSIT